MVNGLFSLLHGVVVVVAIGAAVTPVTTTTSQSTAAISQPPPSSNNLEPSGVQVGPAQAEVITESSVPPHGNTVGDFLEETGAADNGYDREASRENHTDLCGTSTTGARNSIFCPVNTSSTKNLRGQRSATVNKNVGPSNHRIKGNGVEVKSPDVEEGRKEKKRFLRWARDEEEKSNGSKRSNKDHHGKAPAGDERYLRASVEGAAVVNALRTSGEDAAVVDVAAAAKALRGRGRSDYALDGVPPA